MNEAPKPTPLEAMREIASLVHQIETPLNRIAIIVSSGAVTSFEFSCQNGMTFILFDNPNHTFHPEPPNFLDSLLPRLLANPTFAVPPVKPVQPEDLLKMIENVLSENYTDGVAVVNERLVYLNKDVAAKIAEILYDARTRDKESMVRELETIIKRLQEK